MLRQATEDYGRSRKVTKVTRGHGRSRQGTGATRDHERRLSPRNDAAQIQLGFLLETLIHPSLLSSFARLSHDPHHVFQCEYRLLPHRHLTQPRSD